MGLLTFIVIVSAIVILGVILKIIWDIYGCFGPSTTDADNAEDPTLNNGDCEMGHVSGQMQNAGGGDHAAQVQNDEAANVQVQKTEAHAQQKKEATVAITMQPDTITQEESVRLQEIEDILSVVHNLWKQFNQERKNKTSASNTSCIMDVLSKLLVTLYDIKCGGRQTVREARNECANLILHYIQQLEKMEELSDSLR